MEIKFKINWSFIGEFLGLFVLYLFWFSTFAFVFIMTGMAIASQNQPAGAMSARGNAVALLIFGLALSLEITLFTTRYAPKYTPEGKLTVRGLKEVLGNCSQFQPTNIDTLTEEANGPENRSKSKRKIYLSGK